MFPTPPRKRWKRDILKKPHRRFPSYHVVQMTATIQEHIKRNWEEVKTE